jgi:hypothetical protein
MANQVLIPIIRNVMPSMIAQSIIGEQALEDVFEEFITIEGVWSLQKEHFQHFLRVNNRKKYHKIGDIAALGYPMAKANILHVSKAKQWCRDNLKPGSYVTAVNRFCFANKNDWLIFTMKWS